MSNRRAKLAERRKVLGLSQDALAARLGVERTTVYRWEAGTTEPLPWMRLRLAQALKVSPEELDALLGSDAAPTPEPASGVAGDFATLAGVGSTLTGQEHDMVWELMMNGNDGIGRQQFLRLLLAAGIAPAAVSFDADGAFAALRPARSALDPRAVESYRAITALNRGFYWNLDATTMLEAVLGHLRLGTQLLRQIAPTQQLTASLSAAVAETALLAARVALFDLSRPQLAERCFATARTAVGQTLDHDLAAAITAHHAFVPGFAGDAAHARPHLAEAAAHAAQSESAWLRSWVNCVAAEVHARTGHPARSRAHIAMAGAELTDHDELRPEWFDFYDPARLAGFAGNAELLGGDPQAAQTWLTSALDGLDEKSIKQRPVLLLDLAAASAELDPDQAVGHAEEAMSIMENAPYATAVDRMHDVVAALAVTPYGPQLAERATALTGTSR
ncbi:helix-turn-helix transcriptional regulator [Myceligenerans crystallogenes]|uniref:HTH cro/C1-type domain-containing protein n=1 Tax=Myceligenerans crystallogenes TaxID=316335 RepID=A0ABN2N9R8_9MICO